MNINLFEPDSSNLFSGMQGKGIKGLDICQGRGTGHVQ